MSQISNIGRKTKVIRVPRKYEFLCKTFVAWLASHPDQAQLWDCEEFLQAQQENCIHRAGSSVWRRKMNEAMKQVFGLLKI